MTPNWRLDFLGDAAVAVQVSADSPLDANACVHRLARGLRAAAVAGVRDIVPGMHDLVVHVDPLRCDLRQVEAALQGAGDDEAVWWRSPMADDLLEIPVVYGGEHGPDLDDVARATGLSPDEVCRRHAATEYVVCFVGFLPGFPYLGLLDPSLRLPRRASPRARVTPGAVAIAGEYTGIYPWASPGGWHLIGHTGVTLFDPQADPPARVSPGMRVRFVAREP